MSFVIAQNGVSQQTQIQGNIDESTQTPQNKIKKIIQARNKIKAHVQAGECPENCTCTGSVMKCEIEGGREMTIRAGKSGNTIVQVKGVNMSTNVTLYKSEGKVYGVFKNNQTRIIKIFPDEIKAKIKQRIKAKIQDEEIKLDEDGVYQVRANKKARLFFIIPVKEKIRTQINSETGEIIKTRTSWWGFLARDVKEDNQTKDTEENETGKTSVDEIVE